MPTLETETTCRDSISASRLARALWESMNCSVQEFAIRSGFPASAKTLWRLIQFKEPWNPRYTEPLILFAAEHLHIPPETLRRCILGANTCLDQKSLEFLFSRFWHPNPGSLERLDRYMQQHEDVGTRWFYVGAFPSLCFFPERPLRRIVRRHFRQTGQSNTADMWTAFGLSWRERFMNSSVRPERVLLTFRSTFDAIRNRRVPFDCLDAEDQADLIYSMAYDAVGERGLRLALLDDVAGSVPQSLHVHFEGIRSVLVMSDYFMLRGMTPKPVIRTVARNDGPTQAQLVDQQLGDIDRVLEAIGGPMDKKDSFKLLLSLLD